MEYIFCLDVIKNLRKAYCESPFAEMKTSCFNKPSDKRGEKESVSQNSNNCVCACMDRINTIVNHCNDLFATEDSIYKLCDILNYGQTLIDCVSKLAEIFGVMYPNSNDCSCFNEKGINGKGSDEKYFKYIRSLCSVHPVETNRHSQYQGEEPEWSPWIEILDGSTRCVHSILDKTGKADKANFVVVVYRNDMEFNKHIYVSLEEIFEYLNKRYLLIYDIIKEIKKRDRDLIEQLKNSRIKSCNEFKDYDTYLDYLKNEYNNRGFGDLSGRINEWKAILHSTFKDNKKQKELIGLQDILKCKIQNLHDAMQRMDYEYEGNLTMFPRGLGKIPDRYAYSVEKIFTILHPCCECEDFSVNILTENEQYSGDRKRLELMFQEVENYKKDDADASMANQIIDRKFGTDASEWARVQLKWIEDYMDYEFDYFLSDWYLYLQVLIAKQ